MAEEAHVRQHVRVTFVVPWLAWSFNVHHNLLPAFRPNGHHGNLFRFASLPEPDACITLISPSLDVLVHGRPPHYPSHQLECLVPEPVAGENTCVALKETPPFPGSVSSQFSIGDNRNIRLSSFGGDRFLQDSISCNSVSSLTSSVRRLDRSFGGRFEQRV